jgi:hypothetical protein
MTRWQELVHLNMWHTHEEDKTVRELDEEIAQNRLKQIKVYTLINENKKKIGERHKGMKRLVEMAAEKG